MSHKFDSTTNICTHCGRTRADLGDQVERDCPVHMRMIGPVADDFVTIARRLKEIAAAEAEWKAAHYSEPYAQDAAGNWYPAYTSSEKPP